MVANMWFKTSVICIGMTICQFASLAQTLYQGMSLRPFGRKPIEWILMWTQRPPCINPGRRQHIVSTNETKWASHTSSMQKWSMNKCNEMYSQLFLCFTFLGIVIRANYCCIHIIHKTDSPCVSQTHKSSNIGNRVYIKSKLKNSTMDTHDMYDHGIHIQDRRWNADKPSAALDPYIPTWLTTLPANYRPANFLKTFFFKHWKEIVKSGAISGWTDEDQF